MKQELSLLLSSISTLEHSLFETKTDRVDFSELFEHVPYLKVSPLEEYSPAVENAYSYLLKLKAEISLILFEDLPLEALPKGYDAESFAKASAALKRFSSMSSKKKLRTLDDSMDSLMEGFTCLHQKRVVAANLYPISIQEQKSWNRASVLMASFRMCLKEDSLLS